MCYPIEESGLGFKRLCHLKGLHSQEMVEDEDHEITCGSTL